jgi:hypothetical protein
MLKIEITIREIPEKNEDRKYAEAFDRLTGRPLEALDELIDSLRADNWNVRRGRHAE